MTQAAHNTFSIAVTGQSLIKEDVLAGAAADVTAVAALTRETDFAFTGFEGTIRGAHGGWPMKSSFLHVSSPAVFDCLRAMGFNLLSLSNNHAFDLGPGGILSTLEAATQRGLACAGTGADLAAATRAGVCAKQNIRVALVAMDAGPQGEHVYASDANARMPARPGSNRLHVHQTLVVPDDDLARMQHISEQLGYEQKKAANAQVGYRQSAGEGFEFYGVRLRAGAQYQVSRRAAAADAQRNFDSIARARENADCVIAYVHHHHWEPRWEQVPEWFREFAHGCVDAGAGMVVSHGVPMLQGIEIYQGAPLFFGLGNFIFHTFQPEKYTDERIWHSVVAQCRFGARGCEQIVLTPIVMGGEAALTRGDMQARRAPHIARGAYGERILQRLADMSAVFGAHIDIAHGKGCLQVN